MPIGVYARLSGDGMKQRLEQMKLAQSMPWAGKVETAEKIIASCAEHGTIAVMFSGGRDSVVVAMMARQYEPVLLYCDTGLSTERAGKRVREAAEKLGLELVILTPALAAYDMWQKYGHYPIGPKRGHTYLKAATGIQTSPVQCCYRLKEQPAKQYVRSQKIGAMLWGNRAADSNRRKLGIADHGMIQPPSTRWRCWSAQPIALFTDADVAQSVAPLGLDFTARGEDGCRMCCTDLSRKDNQLTRLFVTDRPAFDEAIRTGLGRQILKARGEDSSAEAVETALAESPHQFLRIPKYGKP